MHPTRTATILRAAPLLVALPCFGFAGCEAPAEDSVLAAAAGIQLTTETAAEMLRGRAEPPDVPTVIAKAEAWVDYVLLATAASEDSTLANVDVSSMAAQQLEQDVLNRLGELSIRADTAISDDELFQLFLRDLPGGRVRGGQILLSLPPNASEGQRDSVWAVAEGIRELIRDGGSFEALASEYSSDPSGKEHGGDLGLVSRGELFLPLEEALFALSVGEVSQPVETPFGIHLLKSEARHPVDFESHRASFRGAVQRQRLQSAQEEFMEGIAEENGLVIHEEALSRARLALESGTPTSSTVEDSTPLADHRSGTFTAGEFRAYVRTREPGYRTRLQMAEDEILTKTIWTLARSRLLLDEAKAQGIRMEEGDLKAMSEAIKQQLLEHTLQFGFLPFRPRSDESKRTTIGRLVRSTVEPLFKGGGGVHLRRITPGLEARYGATVFDKNAEETVHLLLRTNQN